MNNLISPFLDEESLELEHSLQDELSFSKQLHSPFLTSELFIENELENELTPIDEELDEDKYENENYNDFLEDDFETEYNADIEDEFEVDYSDGYENEFLDDNYGKQIIDEVGENVEEKLIQNIVEDEISFNIKRAIVRNKHWGRKLKWNRLKSRIKAYLQIMFPHLSQETQKDFAKAVYFWQLFIDDKKPDGILGPKTWAKLLIHLPRRTGVISPSQIPSTGIDNKLKGIEDLAIDIYEAELDILNAWESGLRRFNEVMKSSSDAEISSNFSKEIQNYIKKNLLTALTNIDKTGIASYAKGVYDIYIAEHARTKRAHASVHLRDFIINFSDALRKDQTTLRHNKADYMLQVRNDSSKMAQFEKESYRKRLVDHINHLDIKRESGWLNSHHTFKMIAYAWIRNSKRDFLRKGNYVESRIQIWVNVEGADDRSLIIDRVKINAPGGRKIAEQLLKDTNGGLQPYNWPIYRVFIFMKKNITHAVVHIKSNGNDAGGRLPKRSIANILFKRLKVYQLKTRNIK